MTTDLLALALLGAVVAAAIAAARARGTLGERRATTRFIVTVLGAALLPGFTQAELYPFSAWPLVAGTVPDTFSAPRVRLVDAAGREHDADFRAFQPFAYAEFTSWMDLRFPALPRATQDEAAAWLVARAERVRQRARAGRVPDFGWLGPLDAPFFLLHPHRWDAPDRVPDAPFTGLRLYRDRWPLGDATRGLRRELRYAWRGDVARERPPADTARVP